MHEVEDLVEESIRLLDAGRPAGDRGVRDGIAALLRFQNGFDCSFTHFRVMDILLERGYSHRFPLALHPDPREHARLAALTEFTGLRDFDEEDDDFAGYDSWLEDGYVDPPFLYCDSGTDLWRRMVGAGVVTGPGAEEIRRVPLIEVVAEVAAAAERRGDRDLVAQWYAFGPGELLEGSPWWACSVEELAEVPAVRDLRAIAARTDAPSALPEAFPRPADSFADEDPEEWWFTGLTSRVPR